MKVKGELRTRLFTVTATMCSLRGADYGIPFGGTLFYRVVNSLVLTPSLFLRTKLRGCELHNHALLSLDTAALMG